MVYKWYILPIGGLYATYHPLKEPEKSIDYGISIEYYATLIGTGQTPTGQFPSSQTSLQERSSSTKVDQRPAEMIE